MRMNTLELTTNLLTKKYNDVNVLLKDLARNEEHALFVFAKDFAKEILNKDEKYYWLTDKVDDLNSLIVKQMQNFLKKHYIEVLFPIKINKLTIYLQKNNVTAATKWLMQRYVNNLKNLFDKRSSKGLDRIDYIYFNSLLNNGEGLLINPFNPSL